jgi:hypothetical protein
MLMPCEYPNCNLYGLHIVSSSKYRRVWTCNVHLREVIEVVSWASGRWARVTVQQPSALVMDDLRDWRTRMLAAYEVSRHRIGA